MVRIYYYICDSNNKDENTSPSVMCPWLVLHNIHKNDPSNFIKAAVKN